MKNSVYLLLLVCMSAWFPCCTCHSHLAERPYGLQDPQRINLSETIQRFVDCNDRNSNTLLPSATPHSNPNYPREAFVYPKENPSKRTTAHSVLSTLQVRGGARAINKFIPAGYHPYGYQITELGEQFLSLDQSCLDSDVGRFLASLKSKRKTISALKDQWLEIVRVSKSGQSMRIYRTLNELIAFCLAAKLID